MAHPAVREAVAWSACPTSGGASVRSRPSCVREGASVDAEELRDFLAERVAHWQLPERWAFIDAVPKTSVGKFDKKVLRARYADGGLRVETVQT